MGIPTLSFRALFPKKRKPLYGRTEYIIRARTSEGRERAKARGVKMGRKPKLTEQQRKEAVARRACGEETLADIGKSDNVSGWTIARL